MSLTKTDAAELMKKFAGEINHKSLIKASNGVFIAVTADEHFVCVSTECTNFVQSLQSIKEQTIDGMYYKLCEMNSTNAERARRGVRWIQPAAVGSDKAHTIYGLPTADELINLAKQKIKPIIAPVRGQEKQFREFLDQVTWTIIRNSYREDGYSVDAGLLQNEDQIVAALMLGYTQLTLDCAAKVNKDIQDMNDQQVAEKYAALPEDFRDKLEKSYLEQNFKTEETKLKYTIEKLQRIALTYAEVIVYAKYIHARYLQNTPWSVDFVVSVFDSGIKLTPHANYLIMNELDRMGARIREIV